MNHEGLQRTDLTPSVSQRILEALSHYEAESGPLEMVPTGVLRRGTSLYVPVRPIRRPPTAFAFMHAVAGAEVELRDSGLDVHLTPEFRQPYVVVANVKGDQTPYIYLSEEGSEYDDLARLLGRAPAVGRESATIDGYPFDGPDDQEYAWNVALAEHPNAKVLA